MLHESVPSSHRLSRPMLRKRSAALHAAPVMFWLALWYQALGSAGLYVTPVQQGRDNSSSSAPQAIVLSAPFADFGGSVERGAEAHARRRMLGLVNLDDVNGMEFYIHSYSLAQGLYYCYYVKVGQQILQDYSGIGNPPGWDNEKCRTSAFNDHEEAGYAHAGADQLCH
ncbi:hypothetical protein AB1Y20_005583 [Prymnesium parvum]|uniref:Uncharacterized protein n=1 Tax=Prymnesium parvum TaxID=97485 RepID=A0AB34J6G3_PRYPA